jgi:hypothetical protein
MVSELTAHIVLKPSVTKLHWSHSYPAEVRARRGGRRCRDRNIGAHERGTLVVSNRCCFLAGMRARRAFA